MNKTLKSGFSLVELSIVLVILGLLTGGILGGKELIRAAELRAITTEKDSIVTAVNTFRSKYMALPGDMDNATQFWGNADTGGTGGECASPYTNEGTGTQTCNGNGSGTVADTGNFLSPQTPEFYRFWQHLSNASLIAGDYTGIRGSTNTHHIAGTNSLRSKTGGAWMVLHLDVEWPGTAAVFIGNYRNLLFIGRETASSYPNAVLLTPEEAWNIDTKIDDGKPGRGNVKAAYTTTCADGNGSGTDTDADYALQDTTLRCVLYFTNLW